MIIDAQPDKYTFSLQDDEAKLLPIGSAPASILAREREYDSYFIGTFLGLYACGTGGVSASCPAVFSDISWRGVRAGGP